MTSSSSSVSLAGSTGRLIPGTSGWGWDVLIQLFILAVLASLCCPGQERGDRILSATFGVEAVVGLMNSATVLVCGGASLAVLAALLSVPKSTGG